MWGKLFAALFCLFLFYCGIGPVLMPADWYDANGNIDLTVKALAPQSDIVRAEAYGRLIQAQDMAGLRHETDPSILNDDFYKAVPQAAQYTTIEPAKSTRVLGYHTMAFKGTAGDWTNSDIVIAHYYPDKVIIATTWFHEQNGKKLVSGYNVRRLSNADIASLKFNLLGKEALYYVVLGAAISLLIFSLVTLYICLTRPRVQRRWLWAIFVAFGIVHFGFSWGNGAIIFNLLNFHAPLVTFSQNLLEPVYIHLWLPVGAVLFWFLARQKPIKTLETTPESIHAA